MLRRLPALLFVFTIQSQSIVPAQAGPCTDQIARFEALVRGSAGVAGAGPTGRESVGAKLGHQPTPQSVDRAAVRAQSQLAAVVARAKSFDAQGEQTQCMQALAEARLLFEPE